MNLIFVTLFLFATVSSPALGHSSGKKGNSGGSFPFPSSGKKGGSSPSRGGSSGKRSTKGGSTGKGQIGRAPSRFIQKPVSKGGQVVAPMKPRCFSNALERGAFFTRLASSFWFEMTQTGCVSHARIRQVFNKYYAWNVHVVQNGQTLSRTMNELHSAIISTNIIPNACANNQVSYVSYGAGPVPGDPRRFVWLGNEVVLPAPTNPAAPPAGRRYTVVVSDDCSTGRIERVEFVPAFT